MARGVQMDSDQEDGDDEVSQRPTTGGEQYLIEQNLNDLPVQTSH